VNPSTGYVVEYKHMNGPDAFMLCKNCGFLNPPGMKFCGNCGTRLAAPEEPRTSPEPLPERIGVMMGSDLRERFQQAGLQVTGHRRAVSVLFVDLTGFTSLSEKLESEQLYELLQEFITLAVDIVYRYEGMVDKLTGDGLMALFGAPISHENNAERALRTALDMHQIMGTLNKKWNAGPGTELSIHVGVNDGEVIMGGMGGTGKLLNYTAVGDTVNLAKRLEESAIPGTTYVSESVYLQTNGLFEYQPLPPLAVKGKTGLVTAFKLVGPRSRPDSGRGVKGLHSRMVGRENELQQVKSVIQGLETKKQGGFILVSGEAGIGKSRLKREMKAILNSDDVYVLEGQSLTYRKSIPYWIFQDMMRGYLEANLSMPPATIRSLLAQRVHQVMGNEAGRVLPYLESMLSLDPDDPAAETFKHLDAEQLHKRICLAVRDLLAAEAQRRPVVLILEDLHWADDSSISLILYLLESVNRLPLVIYGISRPLEIGLASKIREFGRQKLTNCYTEIELHSLEPEQSAQLLSSLLALPQIPETLSAEIIQRSAGLPFFMEEMLRVLIEKKVIFQVGEAWQFNPAAESTGLGVPETLQNLILARFDRLDPEFRLVIQTASVIGYQFSIPVMKTVLAENLRPDLGRILQSLVEREFITPQPGSGEQTYSFRHALMSEAIYATLLQRTRKELHGQIGNAIEALYGDHLEDQVELLASHFQYSLLLDKALRYLILAGQKAARRFANAQARQHFEQALALLERVSHTSNQKTQVYEGLAEALLITGEYIAARSHYETVLDELETLHKLESELGVSRPGYSEKVAMLHRKIATTFEHQGDYEKALAQLSAAQQILDTSPDASPAEQVSVLNDMGWIYFRQGNLDLAEKYLLEALPLVENSPYYAVTASIYNRLGGIKFQKDQLNLTVEYTLKALALREKIGDTAAVARSYNNLGLISWKAGNWAHALTYLERSYELQARLGDVVAMIDLHTNLGLLQLDRGESQQAEKHLKEALAISQQIGHGRLIAQVYLNLTYYSAQTGDWKLTLDYCQLSQARYDEIGVKGELVELFTYLGIARLGLGEIELAEQWGQEALTLFDRLGKSNSPRRNEDQGRALRLLGDIRSRRGDLASARKYYEQSIAAYRSVNNQIEYARSVYALSQVANRFSDLDPTALRSEAFKIFTRLGAALDLKKISP
jgi:predicted ATPase/class 3 adenylate cyclase